MAYITKSNARNLEYQVKRSEIEKIMVDDLYKVSLWMLTKKEQQWLAAARIFYENPKFYIDRIYEKVERTSSGNLVYVSGVPAFHADQQCDVLTRDYLNYVIPEEIVARGEGVVAQFRDWWKGEEELLRSDSSRFLEKMGIRWLLRNPPSVNSIEADNSGVDETENRDLTEVENEINELIALMGEVRSRHGDLIAEFGKRTYAIKQGTVKIDNQKDKAVLEDWEKKKEKLKGDLRLYFQLRFNPELELQGSVLESLGFKSCAQCH